MTRASDGSRDGHCSRCEFEQLNALYQLNIAAKEYGESAEEAYNTDRKRKARIHSQRKKGLYNLKREILGEFVADGCADRIERHKIDGREYYCVYVGEFSFHTPVSEWDAPPGDAPKSATELDSFDADPSNRATNLSTKEALQRLTETFESPNHHLESPFTDGYRTFVGWSSLPGALGEGDRVPERYLDRHNGAGDFGFEVGDSFQTREGHCEIVDRYHAYLTPLRDRSPVRQRPAYDVLLAGERKETVSAAEIIDDWWVLAESLTNPLPNVDGRFGSNRGYIESDVDTPVPFEIGDILELQWNGKYDSIYCRLSEIRVGVAFLYGYFESVPPTDETAGGLTIGEIVDALIAVHDAPPVQE